MVVRGRTGAAREGSARKEGGRGRRGEREEIEVGRTARGCRGSVCGGDKSSKQYVFIFNIRYMYVVCTLQVSKINEDS